MSEVIEALEQKGLIERTPHPNHRRVYPAVLTPQGRKVLASCDTAVDDLEEAMLHDLDARQRAALVDGLTTAVRALGAGLPRPLR
jgi:DNA-binding MarR family transcriptional regulator